MGIEWFYGGVLFVVFLGLNAIALWVNHVHPEKLDRE